MSEEQAVFEGNWQDEIQEQQENHKSIPQNRSIIPEQQQQLDAQQITVDSKKLSVIDILRTLSDAEFQNNCKDVHKSTREIGQSPNLLKTQKDFVELAMLTAERLKIKANEEVQKTLNDNHIMIFFEEILLYLHPKYGWENIEHVKEKVKIVKKDRKQDQSKARKLKQKQQRLKKVQKTHEQHSAVKDIDNKGQNDV